MFLDIDTHIANRYHIISILGHGGMGTVYHAHDRLENQSVAVKMLRVRSEKLQFASKDPNKNPRLALINEFRILSSLRHPNIISVFDYGIHDNTPYYVMELLDDADTINNVLDNVPDDQKIRYFLQILQALSYLHRRGIVHRDLKPSNILVKDYTVKVVDFGLSVEYKQASGRAGTLEYMAPETLQYGLTVPQSDLYTVGVLMYLAFAGQLPFMLGDVMGRVERDPIMTPLKNPTIVPIIKRLLQRDPAKRFQTARHVLLAIAEAFDISILESYSVRESFLQASAFVGRDDELDILREALDEALTGKGSVWLVGGESGVGKSRLFDEFRTIALVNGALVLRGQSVEGSGLPFQSWRAIARHLVLSAELTPLQASTLKEIIPDIDELIGQKVNCAPKVDGTASKLRLITTLIDLLKQTSTPIVLMFEDLQWATNNVDVLKQLMFFIDTLPVLVIGNYRSDERPNLPDELGGAKTMLLERLSQSAIAKLTESMLGERGTDLQLLTFLEKETEGNAFFMVEVVRALAEDAGKLSDVGRRTLPEDVYTGGIEQVVSKRLDMIPPKYLGMLRLAAISGRYLNTKLLQILASESNINLNDMLLVCSDIRVFEVIDDRWRFSHDKLREGVLRAISDDQKPQMYERVAHAVEAVYPDNSDYVAILIDLWRMAGDATKELHYLLIEGKKLNDKAGLRNSQRAEQHFLRAKHLSETVDVSTETELDIQLGLGIAMIGTHQMESASEILQRAVEIATMLDDKPKAAQAMVGVARTVMTTRSQDEVIALLNQALALAYEGGNQQIVAASRSVEGYVHAHYGDMERALEAFYAARDALMIDFVDYEVAQMMNNIGKLLQLRGDLEEARSQLQQAQEVALDAGHFNNAILSTSNLGTTEFFSKNYDLAVEYFTESVRLMKLSGDIGGLSHVLILRSFAEAELADLESVQATIGDALNKRQSATWDYSNMYIIMGASRLKLMQGDGEIASQWYAVADRMANGNPFVDEWLAPLRERILQQLDETQLEQSIEEAKELDPNTIIDRISTHLSDIEI